MGSTYLDLTNRVLRRINEVELTSSTFTDARGVHAAAKDAVLDTIRDINSQKFEWPFNSTTGTQILTAGQEEYSWPATLRIPDWNSFYINKDAALSVNTTWLQPLNKDEWQRYAQPQDNDSTTTGLNMPRFVFESSSGGFGVTPSPNAAYTVKYKYYINTITMSAYSDAATIPTEYDHVIMDGALALMNMFLDNDERASTFDMRYQKGLSWMAYILIPKDFYAYDLRITHPRSSSRGMFSYG
jgi:hypothetical protein